MTHVKMGSSKRCPFPADAPGTGHGRSPATHTHSGSQHPWAWRERTSPDEPTLMLISLSLSLRKQMQDALRLPPPPYYTPLRPPSRRLLQPCHLCPSPCPIVKSQEMTEEHSAVRYPSPPLAFSCHLQRLGSNQGRLGPSPTIHTMYPPPSHEEKKKK